MQLSSATVMEIGNKNGLYSIVLESGEITVAPMTAHLLLELLVITPHSSDGATRMSGTCTFA